MDQNNVVVDSEVVYPMLFIPKKCTSLETNCEMTDNVYIDLNITSSDTEGNETCIYSGFCIVKLIDSYDVNLNSVETPNKDHSGSSVDSYDVTQMPVILAEANHMSFPTDNQSQVWIDPSRSPYVYNHYDSASKERYSIRESRGCITVEQHNTYITQNVYKYKESNVYNCREPPMASHQPVNNEFEHKKFRKISETTNQQDSGANLYEDDEAECREFLSQLPEEVINKKKSQSQEGKYVDLQSENNALKQLMSTDIQSVSKQRKTILFLGYDSDSGRTVQNISYNDPMVTCRGLEVDNEVVIEKSPNPKKKEYQCDKCKQIFEDIHAFRKHMVRNHNYNINPDDRDVSYVCSKCGKNLKTQLKFEIHCLGHGDPELECSMCHKVYASKFTLRAHKEIHNRKFRCAYCVRSYMTSKDLKAHLQKIHFLRMCQYSGCPYVTGKATELNEHHNKHNKEPSEAHFEIFFEDVSEKEDEMEILNEEADLKDEEFQEYEEKIEEDRIKQADSVIAKVMANKIFLLNSKKAKKHEQFHKSCEVCYKAFKRISDLKRHLIEHVIRSTLAKSPVNKDGTLDITCEICQSKTFSQVDKYKAHLREHAKLTLYKCTFCDKSFSDSSNFSKHKKIHGDSYFQCDLCQRKFNSKKMITQHMEYHNKNKPVKCKYCSRIFHFQSVLNKHTKSVHIKQASMRFRCRFCNVFFKTLKDKWDHEWRSHNIRKIIVDCLICGAKFRKYSELKRHCIDNHEVNIPPAKNFLKKRYC